MTPLRRFRPFALRGSAQVDPKPTLTAAGNGSLTALTLSAMGRLPRCCPRSSQKGDADAAPDSLVCLSRVRTARSVVDPHRRGVPRSCIAGATARRGGGPGRAQAELGAIPEAAGHDIDHKAHVKYLDLGAARAALDSVCAISGVDSTPTPAAPPRAARGHLRSDQGGAFELASSSRPMRRTPRPAIAPSGSKPRATAS